MAGALGARGLSGPAAVTLTIAPSAKTAPAGTSGASAASPGAAVALLRMNTQIDIRAVLPAIRVPTLVLQRVGDLDANVEEGRFLARHIPGARLIELPGVDHLPWVGDQNAVLDEVQEFLTGVRPIANIDRALVYHTAMRFDHPAVGNELVVRETEGHPRLLPTLRKWKSHPMGRGPALRLRPTILREA